MSARDKQPPTTAPAQSASETSGDARARLRSERERIRRIESTLSELIHELAGELIETESRLEELEQEIDGRTAEIEQLREQLVSRGGGNDAPVASDERLAAAKQAVADSQSEQEELRRNLARANKQLNLRAQELNELRAQLAELTANQSDPAALGAVTTNELLELRAQRQDLIERLADAETRLKSAAQIDTTEVDSLRRRFETAVQEVRELKTRNTELEQLAKSAKPTAGKPIAAVGISMDWESQKQRMLAKLQADDEPSYERERLSLAETVRITDQIVAEKDAEIRDLKQLLEQQSGNIGDMAVGAASLATLLDQDELIRQERDHLQQLEVEWQEKLRKAEVDISLERAKLARERSQFEERLQVFEAERAQFTSDSPPTAAGKNSAAKKGTGRWLARLGLKDDQ